MFRVSFFVDDARLGEAFKRLAGIARNIEHAYVPNVEPKARANGNIKTSDAVEMFSKELHKRSVTTITGPEFREVVEKLGFNRASYSHFLQKMVTAGVLKKGKMEQNSMRYNVTGK